MLIIPLFRLQCRPATLALRHDDVSISAHALGLEGPIPFSCALGGALCSPQTQHLRASLRETRIFPGMNGKLTRS